MVVFPWLVLIALLVLVSIGMLALTSRLWTRRRRQAPFAVGLVSSLLLAVPILLLVLAWGLLLKPR